MSDQKREIDQLLKISPLITKELMTLPIPQLFSPDFSWILHLLEAAGVKELIGKDFCRDLMEQLTACEYCGTGDR